MKERGHEMLKELLRINIRRLRMERGLSQQDLADELEIDVSGVCNLENGRRELRATELPILAELFGIPLSDLYKERKKGSHARGVTKPKDGLCCE